MTWLKCDQTSGSMFGVAMETPANSRVKLFLSIFSDVFRASNQDFSAATFEDQHQTFVVSSAINMSLVTRKPVFRVFDQVRLKPTCSAAETSWSLEILDLASTRAVWEVHGIWS